MPDLSVREGVDEGAISGTRSVAILTYHSIDTSGSVVSVAPGDFADQMLCLAEIGWQGISLREAVAYHKSNASWPRRSVVLTFDDGYENFYDGALPVLLKHGFSATVFVVSGHMSGTNDWEAPRPGLGRLPILSWQQAAEISAAGIEIGSHTRTHPNLRRMSFEAMEREIRISKTEIEDHIECEVESFAYPFGSFNRRSMDIVRRRFRAACTTLLRRAASDRFHALPRIDMYYVRSPRILERVLTGRFDHYLMARRLGRALRRALRSSS